jgi:hypothetical protein
MGGYIERIAANFAALSKLFTGIALLLGIQLIITINKGVISKEVIGEIAGFVNLIAYLPYFISILNRQTKPNKVTWCAWTLLEVGMSVSYIMSGAGSTKWLPIASVIGMLFTAGLSLKYGKKEWKTSDRVCAIGCAGGIVVWIISGVPVIALVVFLIVDLLAAVPTFIKAWKAPYEEDLFAWVITLGSVIVNLFALEDTSFSIVILPLYNLGIYFLIVLLLKIGRKFHTP